MSGAEIVEEIERETGGRWKPSPGSIYPLLAWLRDEGYTHKSPDRENGMKRYVLTDEGKAFFEEQVKLGQEFLGKLECLAPMFIGGFHFDVTHEKLRRARESAKRALKTFLDIRAIKDSLTQQDAEEIAKILHDCASKLERITQRIKEKEPVGALQSERIK